MKNTGQEAGTGSPRRSSKQSSSATGTTQSGARVRSKLGALSSPGTVN